METRMMAQKRKLDMDMEGDLGDTKLLKCTEAGTSEYLTAIEDIDPPNLEIGSASNSRFVSPRIERMMQKNSTDHATDNVTREIEASKDHWSEVDSDRSKEQVAETNRSFFQQLQKEWGGFFYDYGDRLKIGHKIAEGAQAEIFECQIEYLNGNKVEYALKVFKEDWSLQELRKQWPEGMHQKIDGRGILTRKGYLLYDATLLKDGRFAFRMQRCWGDLRKLIDLRMQRKHNKCSPFTDEEASRTMFDIAKGMRDLHESNIVHRDLKASNVLVFPFWEQTDMKVWDPTTDKFHCDVTDYECALGVVGTGFWRAPEILSAVKRHGLKVKPDTFDEKSDVYSYAMTCCEILTGCLPCENVRASDYDHVIGGGRPSVPGTVKPAFKELLEKCWHHDASKRPTFSDILQRLLPKCPISNSLLAIK